MAAIKCVMRSQSFGPFLMNMSSPFLIAIVVFLALLPMTIFRRLHEQSQVKRDELMARRREKAALEDVAPTPPRWEPVVDVGGLCCAIPRKLSLSTPCCRKPAGEEYVQMALRKARGQPLLAPTNRALLPIDMFLGAGVPHAMLLALPCCRVKTTEAEKAEWRARKAVRKQRVTFKRMRRFVSVMVLFMYSLYPTLVASTASIFNCSDPIEGKQYLLADLTVTCFEGNHLAFLGMAVVSVVVYCIGTPLIFAVMMSFELCVCHRPKCKEGKYSCWRRFCLSCTCNCKLRSSTPWGYRIASVRERFGLLVAGYDTERGAFVMAWEPLVVMLRKLFITLAGSLPRDPYIQITIALVILIGSMVMQALVQPYESKLLNILDVISLFVLVITQCLSILYLYLDSKPKDEPLPYRLDRGTVEIGMTITLFAANIFVIVTLFGAYVTRVIFENMRECELCATRSRGRKEGALDGGGGNGTELVPIKPLAVGNPFASELNATIAKLREENNDANVKIAQLKAKNERLQFERQGDVLSISVTDTAPSLINNPMHHGGRLLGSSAETLKEKISRRGIQRRSTLRARAAETESKAETTGTAAAGQTTATTTSTGKTSRRRSRRGVAVQSADIDLVEKRKQRKSKRRTTRLKAKEQADSPNDIPTGMN